MSKKGKSETTRPILRVSGKNTAELRKQATNESLLCTQNNGILHQNANPTALDLQFVNNFGHFGVLNVIERIKREQSRAISFSKYPFDSCT